MSLKLKKWYKLNYMILAGRGWVSISNFLLSPSFSLCVNYTNVCSCNSTYDSYNFITFKLMVDAAQRQNITKKNNEAVSNLEIAVRMF